LRRTPAILLPCLVAAWLIQCGCTAKDASPVGRLEARDASDRILAIVESTEQAQAAPVEPGAEHRQPLIPLLVDRLDDEDEGVRFYAILALEKLTGTRLGYDYAATAPERRMAVRRWREHVRSQDGRIARPGAPAGGAPAVSAADEG
jgi:hypothetical protein